MRLTRALRDCKQRCLTVSKKAPTVSKKLPTYCFQGGAKGGRQKKFDHFFSFSVTFWSLFLSLLSLFSSTVCQTPFAGLLLRHGGILCTEFLFQWYLWLFQAESSLPCRIIGVSSGRSLMQTSARVSSHHTTNSL